MRSVLGIANFPAKDDKFFSTQGDTLFTIVHGDTEFIVNSKGTVLSPAGTSLTYDLTDEMTGVQSGQSGPVKSFLAQDPSMTSPSSSSW
jgi:hypothetical protein